MQDVDSASHLKIHQLKADADPHLEGEQVHLQLQVSAAQAVSQNYKIDTVALELHFGKLNAHWLEAMMAVQTAPAAESEAWMLMLQQLPLFLESQPDLAIKKLSVHTPEDRASVSGRA